MTRLEIIEDAVLDKMAHILGDMSAAANAKDELERRRASGENVAAYRIIGKNTIVVGPKLEASEREP